MKRTIAASTILLLMFPLQAFAYLDPGTGSAILQGILGALAALAVVLKLYWHRFLKLIGIRKDLKQPPEETEATDTDTR
jgi:membrane protein implicated in regulation of membrane protease activity